jgi:processive 1,2-diacylglycerol beta-glucosyltransferase
MGAGHDLATEELARRLRQRGYDTHIEDYLLQFPLRIGLLLRWIYSQQLERAPWAYEVTFRIWFLGSVVCRALEAVLSLLTARRLLGLVRQHRPAAVVSTYPLQALVLGRLRSRGRLEVPLVTFITDFGVHPLWMHPGVDLTLCVHPRSARVARQATTRSVRVTGPMVKPQFHRDAVPQTVARARLGLPLGQPIALVVAGSWGVGDIEATFAEIQATGRYLPVAVCGRNDQIKRRLEAKGYGVVFGWTDRMHDLMCAADVLVQNAGGLSCSEAFSVGLPVVTYHPIAGHGRKNASEMVDAGVTLMAEGPGDLGAVLDLAVGPAREDLIRAGRAVFQGDPAAEVDRTVREYWEMPAPARPARVRHRSRRLAAAALALTTTYVGLNLGVDAATAHGLDAATAPVGARDVYLAIRLGPQDLYDPGLAAYLAQDGVTAVVPGHLAYDDPSAVRHLADEGVNLAAGDWTEGQRLDVVLPTDDLFRSAQALELATGRRCGYYAPDAGVSGADLASALVDHLRIVRSSRRMSSWRPPRTLAAGRIYVLPSYGLSPAQMVSAVVAFRHRAQHQGLRVEPVSALR